MLRYQGPGQSLMSKKKEHVQVAVIVIHTHIETFDWILYWYLWNLKQKENFKQYIAIQMSPKTLKSKSL